MSSISARTRTSTSSTLPATASGSKTISPRIHAGRSSNSTLPDRLCGLQSHAITGPLAANPYGAIAGFVWTGDNSQHVTYVGQDGHLHDLSYNSGTCWTNTDLTVQVPNTSLPDASTGIA